MPDKQLDLQTVVTNAQLSDVSVEIKSNEHPEDRAVRLEIEKARSLEVLVRNKFRFYVAAIMLILLFLTSIVDIFLDGDNLRKQFSLNVLTSILADISGASQKRQLINIGQPLINKTTSLLL